MRKLRIAIAAIALTSVVGLGVPALAQETETATPITEDTTPVSDSTESDAPDQVKTEPIPSDTDAVPASESSTAGEAPQEDKESSAADTGNTTLEKLVHDLALVVIPAFAALVMGLVTMLLNYLRKKFKLGVSDKQIAVWANLARKGALRGAEWAKSKVADLAEGEKVPGPEVLDTAVDWTLEMGRAMGLPNIGREKLKGLVESELFQLRKEENKASV